MQIIVVIKPDDLQDEKEYLEKQIASCQSESYSAFLKTRLEKINHALQHKIATKEEHSDSNFIGIFSYFIGVPQNIPSN